MDNTTRIEIINSIRKTKKKIGELYPVLFSKDGELLDGDIRLATGDWTRKEILENVTTNIEKIVVKFASNYRRRMKSLEKRRLINDLAEELIKENIAKPDPDARGPVHLRDRPVVVPLIIEILGISEKVINGYLDDKYKRGHGVKSGKIPPDIIRKRGRTALRADMLKHLYKNKPNGLKRTVLMYKSNISWLPLKRNLAVLTENGLVEEDDFYNYHITIEGMKILVAYEYAEYYLNEIDEVNKIHDRGSYLEERVKTGLQ